MSISNVINSRWGQSALIFGALAVASAVALIIFQKMDPTSFMSGGGLILYSAPGTLGGAFVLSLLGYVIKGRNPLGFKDDAFLAWIDLPSLYDVTSKNYSFAASTLYKNFKNHQAECTDLASTARVLRVPEENLTRLFEHFGFPSISWNDPGCLNTFFTLLNTLNYLPSMRGGLLITNFDNNHPLWPESKAPSRNNLTVPEFALFVGISVEDFLELQSFAVRGTVSAEDTLTPKQMEAFCKFYSTSIKAYDEYYDKKTAELKKVGRDMRYSPPTEDDHRLTDKQHYPEIWQRASYWNDPDATFWTQEKQRQCRMEQGEVIT